MYNPKIQWYIKDDGAYTPKKEHYAGSFIPEDEIKFVLRAWNNRFGTAEDPAGDIINPVLKFFFGTTEDSALLNYCTVSVDGGPDISPTIEDKAFVVLGREVLSGAPNTGTEADRDNYLDITITFNLADLSLKKNDLKDLYLEICSM